ncbi:MAG TPA: ABC transporter substrate-binding protein [Ktedonobacteraceae bacterium]
METHLDKSKKGFSRVFKGSMLLGMALLAILLAACSNGSGNATTPSTSNAQHVLTVVSSPNGDFTENYNPLLPNGNGNNLTGTDGLIYETLSFYNQMKAGAVSPMLATSQTLSTDGKTATFHLRSGVQWSDGQPFTSADVVFTINYIIQHAADGVDIQGLKSFVKSVTAPDASTVVVTFNAPSATNMWYLAGQTYIMPQHIWQNISTPKTEANTNPVGTGPYTLKSFSPQVYKFVKNTKYWGSTPLKVNEVDFLAYASNTAAQTAISTGSVDWAGLYLANVNQVYVSRDPSHNQSYQPGNNITVLMLNLTKPMFQDINVRKAISAALNRAQYSTVAETGQEQVSNPTGLLLPNFQSLLDPSITQTFGAGQPTQSATLLQASGWAKDSNGYFAKAGKELEFSLLAPSGWSDWNQMQTLIASDLKAAGIKVDVQEPQTPDWYSKVGVGSYDATINYSSHGPSPYYFYNSILNSTFSAPIGKSATTNFERWNDPTTDKLLNDFANTTDANKQQQDLNGLEQIMVNQLPVIPMLYGADWDERTTSRFTGWPTAANPYAQPAPFDAPDIELTIENLTPVA